MQCRTSHGYRHCLRRTNCHCQRDNPWRKNNRSRLHRLPLCGALWRLPAMDPRIFGRGYPDHLRSPQSQGPDHEGGSHEHREIAASRPRRCLEQCRKEERSFRLILPIRSIAAHLWTFESAGIHSLSCPGLGKPRPFVLKPAAGQLWYNSLLWKHECSMRF